MWEEDLLREIRLQSAILKAAFRDSLGALAEEIRSDPVSAAIVSYLEDNGRTQSGALKGGLGSKLPPGAEVSSATVSRRLAKLENQGVLERPGL